MEEKDFKAEYSKSNRAGCKSCKMNISKDVLRMAIMVQSPHFDGKQPNWFHFDCFWARGRPTCVEDISGVDNLRWDDQQKIKDRLAGKSSASGGKKSKAASSSSDSGINYKDYNTEYAKTGKSKCRGCEDFIPKGEVRVSKKNFTSQRAMAYGPHDDWYHVDCFIKERDGLDFGQDKDISKIGQFPCLKSDDKKMLIEKFGKVTAAPKRKAEGGSSHGGKPAKAAKVDEESEEEKAMKKQNQQFWKCRDTLESQISKDAMKGLLEYNNQEIPSGDSNILNRLADVMTFGALKRCPECKDGQLSFSSSGYRCHGNLTEWTKCQYVTSEPKRGTFKIPTEYMDVDYLKNYKCKVQTRIIPKANVASTSAAASLGEKKVVNSEKPLTDMKFTIIGKVADKKKLTKDITSLGGEVVSKLDEKVSACFSTKEEVDADGKKMIEARGLNIRVLSEAFLKEIKGGDLQELLKKHSLSYWGEFTKPKPTKSIPQIKSAARDAAMYTKSMPATMKMTVKGGSAVDPDSGLERGYHVLKVGNDLYSVVLNMVDVMKGTNSYYKLQVLEPDSSGSYYVFRSWGRVGTTIGGTKNESFYNKAKAIDNFETLYAEKTGNEWEDRAHFKKQPHKFYPIEMDYGEDDLKMSNLKDAGAKSELAKPIQNIIKMIFDVESMKKAMVEYEIDLKKMPLGKLSKKQVEKAYSVLTEVQGLLSSGGSATKFLDCSNRFYTLIPHDFGMEKPPLIDNEEILKMKTGMLDSLLEIEVAYSLMKSGDSSEKDPIDVHYEQLKTDMEVLDRNSEEFKRLIRYVDNTQAATHSIGIFVEDIIKIKRHGEAKKYKPFKKLHNRQLLWHGSRTTNYAGILSQGLRIAPPEAPVTGYMFGKGVYFADMCSKSANYCRTTSANPDALMLLCEVALGTMYEKQSAEMIVKPPGGCHSTKGVGRTEPNAKDFYTDPDGVIYPMGKGGNTGPQGTSLLYNEYIVYDTAQIQMKYLLKMKMSHPY